MIKKLWPLPIFITILVLVALYLSAEKKAGIGIAKSKDGHYVVHGRKVAGLKAGEEEKQIKDLKIANTVTEDWKDKVQRALVVQGGSELESVEIVPKESFI